MKKLFRRSRDVRNDGSPLQGAAEYGYHQHSQPQHGTQHLSPTGPGNPAIVQGFGRQSVTPQQQQQPSAQQIPLQYQQQQQQQQRQQSQSPLQQQIPFQRGFPPFQLPHPTSSPSPGPHGITSTSPQSPPPPSNEIGQFLVEQADILIANHDFNGAITTYTLAIQNNPMDPDLLFKRAYAYRMVEPPKLQEAIRDAQTATRNNPYDWRFWSQLGQIYLQNQDAHLARDALEKAIELGGSQVPPVTYSALDAARAAAQQSTPSTSPRIQVSPPAQPPQPSQSTQPILRKPSVQTAQPPRPIPPIQTLQPIQSSQLTPVLESPQPVPESQTPQYMPAIQPLSPMMTPIQTTFSSPQTAAPPSNSSVSPQSTQTPGPPQSPRVETEIAGPVVLPTTPVDTENSRSAFAPLDGVANLALVDLDIGGSPPQPSDAQTTDFRSQLSDRLRGAMSAKAFTTGQKADTVKLVYVGLEQGELTNRELGTPVFVHPAFQRIYASTVDYPGSTYLDFDPETLVIYDGGAPGTLSVSGYAEEYRQQQFAQNPRVMLALEQQIPLPTVTLDFLVRRIYSLQRLTGHSRTDASLKEVLGDSPLLTGTDSLHTQIEALCYTLNRQEPGRFAIYTSNGRNVTNHLFGSKDQGIGVKNWLHQIVLGSELLLRLRTETQTVDYTGLVTDQISALLFVCDEFMKDIDIQIRPDKPNLDDPGRYTFVAREHARQTAALIRFAEALQWPDIDEVRKYCDNVFDDIVAGRYVIFDMYDWLYSLFRPGFHFRFQLMSCLRYATPKVRDLGGAPYYESGIVIGDRSYWSRRTVLGKVLGGCKSVSMVCGWIGPCVKPVGVEFKPVVSNGQSVTVDGTWVELTATALTCPVPCNGTQDTNYQYQRPDEDEATFVRHLSNVDNWMPASGPSIENTSRRESVQLKNVTLTNVKGAPRFDAPELEKRPSYRASVTFNLANTKEVSYVLYNNPFFVYANPCVGEHPLFDRQIAKLAKNTFHVSQLKEVYPDGNTMIVIDALSLNTNTNTKSKTSDFETRQDSDQGGDEECLARAWCSERGFNAVVRRGTECCFGCAVTLASQRLGLGFNVLICS